MTLSLLSLRQSVLCFFVVCAASLQAQTNMLTNRDFENISACPTQTSSASQPTMEITKCLDWWSPNKATPDFFNSCGAPAVGIPFNMYGNQPAFSGNGYVGAYFSSNLPQYREYIQGRLISPMLPGHRYHVVFNLSLAESSRMALGSLGVHFAANAPFIAGTVPLTVTPQAESTPGLYYKDTTLWMEFNVDYTAAGGEEYITFGNFRTEATTDTLRIKAGGGNAAYYYIDHGYVIDQNEGAAITIPNVFTPNEDGINDVIRFGFLQDVQFMVYDRWGLKMAEITQSSKGWDGRTTSGEPCSEGTYFYSLRGRDAEGKEYNLKGQLQLFR